MMPTPTQPPNAGAAARHRIGARVRQRLGCSADRQLWDSYTRHAVRLPHLLQQHGLRLTLEYLNLLAGQRDDTGALALLQDWLTAQTPVDPRVPDLAHVLRAACDAAAGTETRLLWNLQAERLARQDAQAFKRYAELLPFVAQMPNPETTLPATERQVPRVLGDWLDRGVEVPASDPCHLALALRFGGRVPPPAEESTDTKTYRTQRVRALVALGGHWLVGWRGHDPDTAPARLALDRRKRDMARIGGRIFSLELTQRLYSAHGDRGVWETWTDLHSTLGIPVIRGSSLKAALRRHLGSKSATIADDEIRAAAQAWSDALLGSADAAGTTLGVLQVHDAWWMPGEAAPAQLAAAGNAPTKPAQRWSDHHAGPLVADIDTPHHAAYYQGTQDTARAADSPEPQPQLAVRGRFLFCLTLDRALTRCDAVACPDALAPSADDAATASAGSAKEPGWDWLLKLAEQWLTEALAEDGVGGARRVGGGLFAPPPAP